MRSNGLRDYKLYISDMIESIIKIQSYVDRIDYKTFIIDSKTYDAVLQNFLIIGEAANKIPDTIQMQYSHVDWRGIIGMRNVIIHGYFKINPDIIWKTIHDNLPGLLTQLKELQK